MFHSYKNQHVKWTSVTSWSVRWLHGNWCNAKNGAGKWIFLKVWYPYYIYISLLAIIYKCNFFLQHWQPDLFIQHFPSLHILERSHSDYLVKMNCNMLKMRVREKDRSIFCAMGQTMVTSLQSQQSLL